MAGKRTSNRYMGNYGLYNFSGSGPSSSPPPPLCGDLGSVISLPGCADQCLHADTAHLYDFTCPTHYVNLFAVGGEFGEEVGQTAFVKGSQDLEVCARMQEDRKMLEENVVRPFLGLGDAVLFDCRVLHFGTENRGEIRPVIYTNYWREFYRDPKNWDERESLFEGGEGEGSGES